MNKLKTAGVIVLLTAGMVQAAIWTSATTDWNSTTAWDTGDVPNGYGEWAQINSATQPNLGGQTITLGRTSNYSLQTTGVGNRVFSNGALNFERGSTDLFANDLHLAATGVNSFGIPLNFTRTAASSIPTRIKLNDNASQATFVEPITWSNSQLQFLNASVTGTKLMLVKNTVTGSTSGKSLWVSAAGTTRITFQNVISATATDIELQIAANNGTIIFDSGTGAAADSSLSLLRFLGSTLQVNQDDQVATSVVEGGSATWNLNGHNNQNTGSLKLNAAAASTLTVNFGNAAGESLWFEDSSAESWATGDILDLTGFVLDTDELRFGTDANGLTSTQLGQIRIDGSVVPGLTLDSGGYLIPEPATIGLLGLATSMLLIARRIRI